MKEIYESLNIVKKFNLLLLITFYSYLIFSSIQKNNIFRRESLINKVSVKYLQPEKKEFEYMYIIDLIEHKLICFLSCYFFRFQSHINHKYYVIVSLIIDHKI